MEEIIKVCKHHGELTLEKVIIENNKKNGLIAFKCKLCKKDYRDRNREKERERSRIYEATKRVRNPEKEKEYHRNYSREWRRKNADLINERMREDRKKNPEKYKIYEDRKRNKDLLKSQEKDVLKKHKISYEDYKAMRDEQQDKCAICGKEETRRSRTDGQICRLAIDHDHKTGKIRALLCHECNTGLGKFKDNEELFLKAIEYLKKHKCIE